MAKNKHPLAIFGGDITKGTGFNGHDWDISKLDKSEYVCEPERDRRIIYRVKNKGSDAEARIREARKGSRLELIVFVWSKADEHGIRVIYENVPYENLATPIKRRAYLRRVAHLTENLAKQMVSLDSVVKAGRDKLTDF